MRIGTAPRPSAPPAGPVSYSISATRSPSIEMSMSSNRAFDAGRPGRPRTRTRASAGKTCSTTDAAARAVRRALDVIPRMLRHVAGAAVGRVDRRRVAIADRHAADGAGRVEVRLEQRRRQRLRVGDVVEVRALGVERQPVAGVDVEREQIVDRARVLGAVQALEGAAAGIRLDRRGARRRPSRAR